MRVSLLFLGALCNIQGVYTVVLLIYLVRLMPWKD